jgi:two-component system cell cycle response regulator DivK
MPRILIVDDNEEQRLALSRQFKERGFAIVTATDGKQAIVSAQNEKPDLVLMDLNMPGMDGWEATRQIKSAPETRDLVVIVLAEQTLSGDRERAFEAGCAHYHAKPVDFGKLIAQIEVLLIKQNEAALEIIPIPATA